MKKLMTTAVSFCLLLTMGCFSLANATSINVDPLRTAFMPAQSGKSADMYQDLKIYNTGDNTAYVQVSAEKVNNPANPNSTLTAFNGNPTAFGLLVSPNKLVIPAGQFRVVRLVRTDMKNQQDLVYKIHVVPVVPPITQDGQVNQTSNQVQLVVSFDVYAVLVPVTPIVKYSLVRKGNVLTVANTGNTNFLLFSGKQCDAKGANCQTLMDNRVYAGATQNIQLPYSTPVKYNLDAAGQAKTVESN